MDVDAFHAEHETLIANVASDDRDLANQIASLAYRRCTAEKMFHRAVFIIAKVADELTKDLVRSPTERALRLLYGEEAVDEVLVQRVTWRPFGSLLERLDDSLAGVEWFSRAIAACRIVGWKYPPIAHELHEAIESVKAEAMTRQYWRDVPPILNAMRQQFTCRFPTVDKCSWWLVPLLTNPDYEDTECCTWKHLKELAQRERSERFSTCRGNGSRDPTNWLRIRWQDACHAILEKYPHPSLFQEIEHART